MHISKLTVVLAVLTPLTLAQRGTRPNNPPNGECNTMPDSNPDDPTSFKIRRALHDFSKMFERHASLYERTNVTLSKRSGELRWDDNCDDPIPEKSKYRGRSSFRTKKDVIEAAYRDAIGLAEGAKDMDPTSKAFRHYFGGPGVDDQLAHFKKMMEGIASAEKHYTIKFECSGSGGICTDPKVLSVANSDSTVGTENDEKQIHICDRFWTSAGSRFLLYRATEPGGAPPFRDLTSSGWCSKRGSTDGASAKHCDFFSTAGHSILHELTHLHSLALYAGLSPDPKDGNRAGTSDLQEGCELSGARDHLRDFKADQEVGSPDYNAESYAAAATELYFMGLCDFSEIRIRTFDD